MVGGAGLGVCMPGEGVELPDAFIAAGPPCDMYGG